MSTSNTHTKPFWHRARCLFFCSFVVVTLVACSETVTHESEPALELPLIPAIEVDHLTKEVREQFAGLQQKLRATPLDGHYNSRYARVLHAYSLYAPAAVMYRRCRLLRPGDLECIYLEALIQRQLGDNAEAIRLLTTLLERKPGFPRAGVVLASSYREQGQVDMALPLFEQAVNADRNNLEAVYGLAMSVMEQGDTERARTLLESLHSDGRQFGIVHAALATINRQEGKPEAVAFHTAAAQRFTETKIPFVDAVLSAVQNEQVGDRAYMREARDHFKAGRLREAASAYAKATTINPDNGSSHASLVGIYGALGNMIGAQRHFERAREINPTDVLPLVSMGTTHMKRGEFSAARGLFAEAVQLRPEHAEARTLQAYCTQLLGEPAQPDEYRRALRDDPTQSLAHYLLGRHLVQEQGCSAALPHFRDSIRIESAQTPAFIPDLVRCLVVNGENRAARAALETGKALARHYNNVGAQRSLEQAANELADQLEGDGS